MAARIFSIAGTTSIFSNPRKLGIGVDVNEAKAKEMGDIIKPLLGQGQSPYAIIKNHPDLGISEKTLYNYIERGVFFASGICDLDLRRKTSRKLPKYQKAVFEERKAL